MGPVHTELCKDMSFLLSKGNPVFCLILAGLLYCHTVPQEENLLLSHVGVATFKGNLVLLLSPESRA